MALHFEEIVDFVTLVEEEEIQVRQTAPKTSSGLCPGIITAGRYNERSIETENHSDNMKRVQVALKNIRLAETIENLDSWRSVEFRKGCPVQVKGKGSY